MAALGAANRSTAFQVRRNHHKQWRPAARGAEGESKFRTAGSW
jgi:hypothetical protein